MDAIAWLYGLQHFGIKLGLESIRALLDLAGRPDRRYPAALVAGTNGKGSVAAMLDALAAAHGLRSGLFTSPHLVRPEERVRIAGNDIAPSDLRERLHVMRARIDEALAAGTLEAHPSFFEVVTALALDAFADARVDVAVLEVGLGGRLDATNAVEAVVSTIVGIDLDHVKTLGGSVASIAFEKAGIVKPGRPVISGAVRQAAVDVIRRVARERAAPFVDARRAVRFVGEDGGALALHGRRRYTGIRLALDGRHQIDNARIALATFEVLGERLGREVVPERVREGLAAVRWPGRLQSVRREGRPALLLDGAHNPAGARALGRHLAEQGGPRPVLLFGAMEDKPASTMLAHLADRVGPAVVTRPPVERAANPAALANLVREHLEPVEAIDSVPAALERAEALAGPDGLVLVTGSLYLVGSVLALLEDPAAPGPVST